jgi:hypothetical protein
MFGGIKMHQVIDRLPWGLKILLIDWFLKRKSIKFDGIPSFSGRWPDINKERYLLVRNVLFDRFGFANTSPLVKMRNWKSDMTHL